MGKITVNQAKTNKLIANASIIVIVLETILANFTNFSLPEALSVFGLALAMFSPRRASCPWW
jgi:hypothetical protein